jgi:putative methyltransferase (TIGR04325 family)
VEASGAARVKNPVGQRKMNAVKSLVLDWLPPAIVHWVSQLRGRGIRFEGEFATWDEAAFKCTGYDAKGILDKVLEATLKVKRGEAAFERDSVLFDEIEYSWPLLAGLMWAAARNGGKLNVLDFGGALGSSYFQNRAFLQTLPEVYWSVVEQTHYVEAGTAHIQDEKLRFYKTIEECLSENRPNVILLSSVLQYLESPNNVIEILSTSGAKCLIIDRTPFSAISEDTILVQKVPSSVYGGSYPMRVFSKENFMKMLDANWREVASNLSPEAVVQSTGRFKFSFQGLLLETRR